MIVVVGSVNIDLVAIVDEMPRPGETVAATDFTTVHGGKGANQAVAASRLGGNVALVAALGSDAEATVLREGLADEGIDIDNVMMMRHMRSGTALITVDAHGENAIVVYPGANGSLELTRDSLSMIEAADVLLMQLEIPMSTVVSAAKASQGTVIVNAAPALVLPEVLLDSIDVLIVNEHERLVALGQDTAERVPTIITTLGARGASVVDDTGTASVPAPSVEVVDTTGAGDTFCGAFAEALDRGEATIDAVRWAVRAGALSTGGVGARTAMPTRADMLDHPRGVK